MAFRASRKTTPKTVTTEALTTAAPSQGEPVESYSVEDVVGGPIDKSGDVTREIASQTQSTTTAPEGVVETPPVATTNPNPVPVSPRRGYTPHGRFSGGYRRGSSGGGYKREYGRDMSGRPGENNTDSYRGNGDNHRGSGDGYRSAYDGYRGSGDNYRGSSYTQDINVPTETVKGMLDIMPEGHGFLRPKFTPSDRDIYISQSQIRRFLLRNGDVVEGQARAPKDNERYWGLLKVEKVNDKAAEEMAQRPKFEDLVPIYPNKLLRLETDLLPLSTRIIDLIAPIGFGQRGLIVSPPKAGKTTILKEIAAGVAANYPDVHLMAALIGERPEEVTDISRSVKGEVLASNFDESPAEQTRIAEVALDRAKRLVEMGHDVVILLDSITRLARAYNLVVNPSGRTLSGGFDPAALYPAKRFLGAARCVEPTQAAIDLSNNPPSKKIQKQEDGSVDITLETPEGDRTVPINKKSPTSGGSLTVIGTALIDTGSRMDDLIYEEFKGTGNMELTLSRVLQERRVFPAIDVGRSGTRHDELLLGEETMKKVTTLRHMLSMLSDEERTMMLVEKLQKTKTNAEFLDSLSKG